MTRHMEAEGGSNQSGELIAGRPPYSAVTEFDAVRDWTHHAHLR
jgi:hypothetical protein